jgi:hypothetical protein
VENAPETPGMGDQGEPGRTPILADLIVGSEFELCLQKSAKAVRDARLSEAGIP